MTALTLALLLVALICTLIELVQAKGKSLLTWGLLCVVLALLWPHLPLR
jgi:hypothetical protein